MQGIANQPEAASGAPRSMADCLKTRGPGARANGGLSFEEFLTEGAASTNEAAAPRTKQTPDGKEGPAEAAPADDAKVEATDDAQPAAEGPASADSDRPDGKADAEEGASPDAEALANAEILSADVPQEVADASVPDAAVDEPVATEPSAKPEQTAEATVQEAPTDAAAARLPADAQKSDTPSEANMTERQTAGERPRTETPALASDAEKAEKAPAEPPKPAARAITDATQKQSVEEAEAKPATDAAPERPASDPRAEARASAPNEPERPESPEQTKPTENRANPVIAEAKASAESAPFGPAIREAVSAPAGEGGLPRARRTDRPQVEQAPPALAGASRAAAGQANAVRSALGTSSPRALNETQFVDAVIRQSRLIERPDGSTELTVSLKPAQLGSVLVRFSLKDDRLTAQVEIEQAGARGVVGNLLQRVKEALAEDGIDLERFDVGLRREPNPNPGNHDRRGQAANGRAFDLDRDADDEETESISPWDRLRRAGRPAIGTGMIDFVA